MAEETIFDLYFRYRKETESPTIFHRWCLISALGAWLGRNTWLPFGSSRIFPNQYIMLVGNPGSRKSVAIKGVKSLLAKAGYSAFSAEKTTKEKFLLDLQGDDSASANNETVTNLFGGSTDTYGIKESYIVADEFNEFVGSGNFEFLSMLGALWDWDDPDTPYKNRVKNSKSVEVMQPTISILGGNTYAGLAEAFPISILGQGFMSRLILVYSEPSGKKITIPPIPSAELLARMIDELLSIKSAVQGPMTMSPQAYAAIDGIYKTWEELEDNRFKHYSTRRFTHLLKLCLIMAATHKRTEIQVADVFLSNTILTFTEQNMPKAMGELGRKRGSDVSSVIMSFLYEAKAPVDTVTLWKQVEKDLDHLSDLTRILQNLQHADKIQVVRVSKEQSGFLPKQRPMSKKQLYFDLNLLRGAEV